jgi:ketosteroid isomerase-like protein
MSEENVEVVEQLIAALNAGDVDQYLALCTPDVEYVGPMTEMEGVARGEGLRAYLSTLAEVADNFRLLRIAVDRLQALDDDRVLALTRISFEPQRGAPGDQPTASLYYFAGAKVRRIEVFLDRAKALEAAGLPE